MPLDTSIINPSATVLQSIANPAPLPTLADIQAKQLALQSTRQQVQAGQLEAQQKQRELDAQQALDSAMSSRLKQNPDGTMSFDHDAIANDMTQRGFGHLVPALQESWTKADQAKATLNKTNGDIAELQRKAQGELRDHMGLLAQGIADQNNDPQAAIAAIGHADIDPAKAQALVQQIQANPTPEFVKSIVDPIRAQSPAVQKLLTDRTTAQARQKTADTGEAKFEAEKPKIVADTTIAQQGALAAQAKNAALPLSQAVGQGTYAQSYSQLAPELQKLFPDPAKNPKPMDILRAAMTPAEQTTAAHQTVEEQQGAGRLAAEQFTARVAAMKEGRESAKQTAEIGPGAVQGWIDSMKQDPDTWKNVPVTLKNGVQLEWQKQTGLPVPRELPAEAKSGEYNSQVAINHIQNMRQLLADPDVAGSIGPIAGRIAKGETTLGTSVSKNPQVAQKQQQLMTAMEYLFVREAKSLMGGRPPQKLMDSLQQVSVNPAMSMPFLQGSLDAAQQSAQRTLDTANQYRFGNARPKAGVTLPGSSSGSTPAAPGPAKTYIKTATGPGGHKIGYDGTAWYDVQTGAKVQ